MARPDISVERWCRGLSVWFRLIREPGGGHRWRRWRRRPVPASGRRRSGDLFQRAGSSAESGAAMSKRLVSRLLGMFQSRTQVGVDKAGNRYFTRVEEVDGAMKERRWVEFKGTDQDSTTVPVEWICWLNGQRKKAPTPEELAELEARRERVKQNIELLKKKEEEERKAGVRPVKKIGKSESPNLQSFVKQQFTGTLDQQKGPEEVSRPKDATDTEDSATDIDRTSEPTGTGATFKPGTWQPPT